LATSIPERSIFLTFIAPMIALIKVEAALSLILQFRILTDLSLLRNGNVNAIGLICLSLRG
jgi:hypothetical protein